MFGLFGSFIDAITGGARDEANRNFNERQSIEQRNWETEMQMLQWKRDDNAFQRAAEDMSKAGLNPLSGFSPVSSGFSASYSPASAPSGTPTNFAGSFGSISDKLYDSVASQEMLDLQNKRINLDAIKSGVNPKDLDNVSDDNKMVKLVARLLAAQASAAEHEANSPYYKGEGAVSKTYHDVKNIFEDVNDYIKSKSGNDLKDVPKVISNVKPVDTKAHHSKKYKDKQQRDAEKAHGDRVQEYYYNSAHKNKNSAGRAFSNWSQSKVFQQ